MCDYPGETDASGQVNIVEKIVFPTKKGPEASLTAIYSSTEELLHKNGLQPSQIAGIGISCGGPLDSRNGIILSPPNLPGWDNVPIVEMTEKRLGIKAFVQNDANACAMAEWKYGAGKGYDNVVFFTFGTGMGAGSSSTDAFIRVRAILPARWDTCACPGMGLWGSVRRVPSKAGAVAAVLRRWGRRWLANVSRWGPRPLIAVVSTSCPP